MSDSVNLEEKLGQRNNKAKGCLKTLGIFLLGVTFGSFFTTMGHQSLEAESASKPVSKPAAAPTSAPVAAPEVEPEPQLSARESEGLQGVQNRIKFEKDMPGLVVPYVGLVEEWVPAKPNAVRVTMEKNWDDLGVREKKGAMSVLANTWFEIVKKQPAGDTGPELWIYDASNEAVESLIPEGAQP